MMPWPKPPGPSSLSLWQRVASIFLPHFRLPQPRSIFEGNPDQTRLERPLPTRTQTRWYQSDIESAILAADNGDLAAAARLSRSLRRDGVLGGLLSTRAGGLTRLPKEFRGSEQVVAAMSDDGDHRLFQRIFRAKELALMIGDGILLGVGVGELVYLPDRPEPVFVRLDPEFLRYRWSDDAWFYTLYGGAQVPVTPGDGRWILHTPGGYQQPWSNGLWASLARSFVAKDHAFQYRENYSGKLANPARVAVNPTGATETEKGNFFQRVMAWGVNTVFGLPPGWDVRLLESNGRGYEVFQQTIATSNEEIIIALVGQMVTVTGGTGFANADIHATIRADLIQDDGDGIASTLNDQAFRQVVNRLFGGSARCSVAWDTKPPADLKVEAEAISAASKAIGDANVALAPYGMRIDAREIATRFKMPVEIIGTGEAPTRQLGPAPSSDATPELASGETPPSDEAAAELAAKMSSHGIARCEHGSSNRCRLCGIERVRDFEPGADGAEHTWAVKWRPIQASALVLVRDVA